MPRLSAEDLEFPEIDKLSSAYYGGGFRPLIAKIFDEVYRCPEPMPYIRFLQLVRRPVWSLPYQTRAGEYTKFREGILPVLEQAGATLTFHTAHEAIKDENVIRLTWHSLGRKSQRWHYKVAYLPHMLHFDRDGFSGWSELYKTNKKKIAQIPQNIADPYFEETQKNYISDQVSKYRQKKGKEPAGSDYVFVPLQLPNDSVISLKLFPQSYVEAIGIAVQALVEQGHRVVIKRHPYCDDRHVEKLLSSFDSPLVEVSESSIHQLIPASRCVVTLNSGVGFESLLYEKPVVCLGKADYSMAGVECADPALVPQAVAEAVEHLDLAFIRRLVFAALNIFQIDTRSPLAFERQVLRALCWNYLEKAER